MRQAILLILILCPSVFAAAPADTVVIWPKQGHPIRTKCPSVRLDSPIKKAEREMLRKQLIRRLEEIKADEARISKIIREERQKLAKPKPLDPEKDAYQKYLREKQLREDDPIYAEMKAEKDDFKAWKQSEDYKNRFPPKEPAAKSEPPIDREFDQE